jgi:uncharacterized RDD family membrane protein YckC
MQQNSQDQFEVTDEILASQGQRFINLLLDYVGQIALMMFVGVVVGVISVLTGNSQLANVFDNMNKLTEYAFTIILVLIYYNLFEIFTSRTFGKFITKTIVVDENGNKPEYQTIMIRSLCRLIPFDVLSFLGSTSRGWHDSISRTYVVKKDLLEEKKKLFNSFEEIGKTEE